MFLLSEFIFCKVLVIFFYWSKDKRKVLESLIPLRWAILEILRKTGRKRSHPRSITASWTESRRCFIYGPGVLRSVGSIPRPLITWACITPSSELLKPREACSVHISPCADAPKSNSYSLEFLEKLLRALIWNCFAQDLKLHIGQTLHLQ